MSVYIYTDAVGALVGLSAAVASNCEACFKVFHDKARELGVSSDDIIRAIKTAEKVKAAPPRRLSELIERTLDGDSHVAKGAVPGSPAHEVASTKTGACC